MSDEVPAMKRQRVEGASACYRCGETGHFARECPNMGQTSGGGGGGDRACFNCGETGHFSRECPTKAAGGNQTDRACYNCGESGHLSRDCPTKPAGGGQGDRACYTCGKSGHLSRDCPNKPNNGFRSGPPRGRACYHCQQEGHLARDCPSAQSGGAPRGDATCFNCGQPGHISRACPVNYRNHGLSMGTMVAGWDQFGPSLYYVDDKGTRVKHTLFSVGSGSIYAYGVLDQGYRTDLSVEEACDLARRSIFHATYRDGASGGIVTVYHVHANGWTQVSRDDQTKLYDRYIS